MAITSVFSQNPDIECDTNRFAGIVAAHDLLEHSNSPWARRTDITRVEEQRLAGPAAHLHEQCWKTMGLNILDLLDKEARQELEELQSTFGYQAFADSAQPYSRILIYRLAGALRTWRSHIDP